MLEVNFNYTNKLVNNLLKIESARETINNSNLILEYDLMLKNEAILKSSFNSISIEGNPLNFDQVKDLFKFKNPNQEYSKYEQEFLNYFNILNDFDNYLKIYPKISKDLILLIHKELTKGILNNPGEFRQSSVIIGNLKTGKVNFVPPQAYKVPYLIDELIDWLNNTDDLYPVLISGIAHYELVKIHPFSDGNGRTSRILATYILYCKKFDIKQYFTLDEFNINRKEYYLSLQSADKTNDLTNWLEYFTEGVLYSINKVKEEVLNLSSINNKFDKKVKLSENETKILIFIENNGSIKNKDIQNLLNISSQSALNYIDKLIKKDLIISKGKGRNTHYIFR